MWISTPTNTTWTSPESHLCKSASKPSLLLEIDDLALGVELCGLQTGNSFEIV
jgi:hypothetical protein